MEGRPEAAMARGGRARMLTGIWPWALMAKACSSMRGAARATPGVVARASASESALAMVWAATGSTSRGGLKLEGALQAFPVSVQGKVCLDIGSSTGGFTDCLLQNGALRVHAVDVGTNQLVWKLRNDPRVIVREQFNARYMQPEDLGEPVQLIVSDVSFISLTKILPAAYRCLAEGGDLLVLIKPQFELQPEDIGPGGIVRDPKLHQRAIDKIRTFVTQELGKQWMGLADSPIKGMEGNREFLAWLR